MPPELIIHNSHQAGRVVWSQDVTPFKKRRKTIQRYQGSAGAFTDADCVWSESRGLALWIKLKALGCQIFDVCQFRDQRSPARNGAAGACVAPADRSKGQRSPPIVIPLKGSHLDSM